VIQLISGAIVMGYWVAGLHFLRFWRRSRDRLFAVFAGAFWLLGVHRLALASHPEWNDRYGSVYLLRLLAFLMILGAIIDKNRASRRPNDTAGLS
jgi:uncharacterized membrane protein